MLAKEWSHADCFAFFGTKPRNPRWSWSGRSDDGRIVSVTLWQDRFTEKGTIYSNSDGDFRDVWKSKPGFVELIGNLKHAVDHTGGLVRVIIAVPKDAMASPRSIAHCHPQKDLVMRVTKLDLDAGTFTLERSMPAGQ